MSRNILQWTSDMRKYLFYNEAYFFKVQNTLLHGYID